MDYTESLFTHWRLDREYSTIINESPFKFGGRKSADLECELSTGLKYSSLLEYKQLEHIDGLDNVTLGGNMIAHASS